MEEFKEAIELPDSQPDLLWKDLVSEFDEDFILFFWGNVLYNLIDFSEPREFLEQEFNETFAANEPGKKISDKIIRYRLKTGAYKFIIVHIEFQGQSEVAFALRMFRYFAYLFIKYGTTDITAIAIYTGASRPKTYNVFKVSHFGMELMYQFNAYTVREQSEAALLESDNPFAMAVLASLYLIKAGKDSYKRLAYKKKLIEIARLKNFDQAKLYRLFNFVQHLVTLPQDLELEFKDFIKQPKIVNDMIATREFLRTYEGYFGKALDEEREEGRQEEREQLRKEKEKFIVYLRLTMGFSAENIANTLQYELAFVQSILDKMEKSKEF